MKKPAIQFSILLLIFLLCFTFSCKKQADDAATKAATKTKFSFDLEEILLGSAVIAAAIRIIWFLISELIKWLKFKLSSKACKFTKELNLSKKYNLKEKVKFYKYLKEKVTFSYILVRFGTDDYLRSLASDQDKYEGRLQNKIIKLDIEPLKDKDLGCRLLFSIPVHKRIGTQFKCFVEVNNEEDVNEIEKVLKNCDIPKNVEKSKSPCQNKRKRVYFLINKFAVEKSVEDIKNNYIFPE